MAGRSKRDCGKERFWRRILRQWRRSGLRVRDFCAQHDLTEPSFYAWRRIVADRDQAAVRVRAESERERASDGDGQRRHAGVCAIACDRCVDAGAFEVVLKRGLVVRVLRGFDADTLRQLLAVLEEERPC